MDLSIISFMLYDRVSVSPRSPVPLWIYLSSNEAGYIYVLALSSGGERTQTLPFPYLYFFHTRRITIVPITNVPRIRPMRIAMMGMVVEGSGEGGEGRVGIPTLALNPDPALVL